MTYWQDPLLQKSQVSQQDLDNLTRQLDAIGRTPSQGQFQSQQFQQVRSASPFVESYSPFAGNASLHSAFGTPRVGTPLGQPLAHSQSQQFQTQPLMQAQFQPMMQAQQFQQQPMMHSQTQSQTQSQSQPLDIPEGQWVYLDPYGQLQGPFSSTLMAQWYQQNYFMPNLQIRRVEESRFVELSQLVSQSGNASDPFDALDQDKGELRETIAAIPIEQSVEVLGFVDKPKSGASQSMLHSQSQSMLHSQSQSSLSSSHLSQFANYQQNSHSQSSLSQFGNYPQVSQTHLGQFQHYAPHQFAIPEPSYSQPTQFVIPEPNPVHYPHREVVAQESQLPLPVVPVQAPENVSRSDVENVSRNGFPPQQETQPVAPQPVAAEPAVAAAVAAVTAEAAATAPPVKQKKKKKNIASAAETAAVIAAATGQLSSASADVSDDRSDESSCINEADAAANAAALAAAKPTPKAPWAAQTSSSKPSSSGQSLQDILQQESEQRKRQEAAQMEQDRQLAAKMQQQVLEKTKKIVLPVKGWGSNAKPETIASSKPAKTLEEIQREEEARSKKNPVSSSASSFASTVSNAVPEPQGAWTTVAKPKPKVVSSGPRIVNNASSKLNPDQLRAASVVAPVSAPREVSSKNPRQEFLTWCRNSMNLNQGVDKNDTLVMLFTLPVGQESKEIIADTIYSLSSTMDGRRFATEFMNKRVECEKLIRDGISWTEALQMNGDVDEWDFQVVKKKGRK